MYPTHTTSSSYVDYAVGMAGSTVWNSVPYLACSCKWFIGVATTSVLTSLGFIVNSQTYRDHTASTVLNSSQTLTTAHMLTNISLFTSSTVVTYTLPTGSNIHTGMIGGSGSTLPQHPGFEWSTINMGSSAGAVLISTTGSTNHSCWGNAALDVNKNARFFTQIVSANKAITYRLA